MPFIWMSSTLYKVCKRLHQLNESLTFSLLLCAAEMSQTQNTGGRTAVILTTMTSEYRPCPSLLSTRLASVAMRGAVKINQIKCDNYIQGFNLRREGTYINISSLISALAASGLKCCLQNTPQYSFINHLDLWGHQDVFCLVFRI